MDALFWKDAAERAVKTVAQVLLTYLGADVVNLIGVDYETAAGIAAGAALVSLLTSVASFSAGDRRTASLVETN